MQNFQFTRHTTSFQDKLFPLTVRDLAALQTDRTVEIECELGEAEQAAPGDYFHCELVVVQHAAYCMHMKPEKQRL